MRFGMNLLVQGGSCDAELTAEQLVRRKEKALLQTTNILAERRHLHSVVPLYAIHKTTRLLIRFRIAKMNVYQGVYCSMKQTVREAVAALNSTRAPRWLDCCEATSAYEKSLMRGVIFPSAPLPAVILSVVIFPSAPSPAQIFPVNRRLNLLRLHASYRNMHMLAQCSLLYLAL